jgi:hypothetical protein
MCVSYLETNYLNNYIMSSRSLAAARSRRAGENAPPVSGNRPVTSIGSQAAFVQQMPQNMGYNMPSPPNNVRTAKAIQPPVKQVPQQYKQFYDKQPQQSTPQNSLPFSKLSVSDAIGLITLRLGRIEQWVIDTDEEQQNKETTTGEGAGIPSNHRIIDNSVLSSIISRLDSLEKNGTTSNSSAETSEELKQLLEDVKNLTGQFKRMGDDVSKHTIELAKNTEQVFRFNRELTETKDILKSFMVKYDMFSQETTQNFTDYELALTDLEKRLPQEAEQPQEQLDEPKGTDINDIDVETDNNIISMDLKNMIKQELCSL